MIRCLVFLSPVLLLLAACGGGGGPVLEDVSNDTNVEAPPLNDAADNPAQLKEQRFGTEVPDLPDVEEPPVLEETLEDTVEETQKPTIALAGIAFVRPSSTEISSVTLREGEFREANGERTLDGRVVRLTSDIAGDFTDASSFLEEGEPAVGVIGIPTDLAAMPRNGSATMSGGAVGLVEVGGAGFDLLNGTSTVVVDFETGTVGAELSAFTSVSQVSGRLAPAPFESIILEGALINGTGFSGGALTTSGGNDIEDIVGVDATTLAQGQFFGTNESGTVPNEAGGVVYTQGESGLIYGSFIAGSAVDSE